jgi:hypothetical protein
MFAVRKAKRALRRFQQQHHRNGEQIVSVKSNVRLRGPLWAVFSPQSYQHPHTPADIDARMTTNNRGHTILKTLFATSAIRGVFMWQNGMCVAFESVTSTEVMALLVDAYEKAGIPRRPILIDTDEMQ